METRVAVLAVIVREADSVAALNALLHQYESAVIGRMGVPCRERGIRLISVALDAPADVISALSGKIGRLPGVTAKTKKCLEENEDETLENAGLDVGPSPDPDRLRRD